MKQVDNKESMNNERHHFKSEVPSNRLRICETDELEHNCLFIYSYIVNWQVYPWIKKNLNSRFRGLLVFSLSLFFCNYKGNQGYFYLLTSFKYYLILKSYWRLQCTRQRVEDIHAFWVAWTTPPNGIKNLFVLFLNEPPSPFHSWVARVSNGGAVCYRSTCRQMNPNICGQLMWPILITIHDLPWCH